jgi:glyoxylase-like metal-dependent hydrolase (beta-lactamase superfamily II)
MNTAPMTVPIPGAPGASYCDLAFLGHRSAIAAGILSGPNGVAIVDPGPSTCLSTLENALHTAGITWQDVEAILLTHIHLDHAGSTGSILMRNPRIDVFVHERGAPHLIDPGKLIDSATRYFGPANMDRFWGEIAAVPRDRLRVLAGGERIEAGGHTLDVLYTPGHAHHHVTYFDSSGGITFVGDVAAMRVERGPVVPPTTPPEFDLELWLDSIERIGARQPQTVFLTHFGPIDDVEAHLDAAAESLRWMVAVGRDCLEMDVTDAGRSQAFGARVRRHLLDAMAADRVGAYEPTSSVEALWFGIARYLRNR